jgi:hypothetical protein
MQEERQSIAEKDAEEEDQLDDAVRLAFEKACLCLLEQEACWRPRLR